MERWLGVSAFVLLGDDAMGVEILCLRKRLSLNTVFFLRKDAKFRG